MILTYEAVDKKGKQKRDSVEATNADEAVAELRRRGLFVTDIVESPRDAKAKPTHAKLAAGPGHLPLKTLALFTRQMAMLLRAGSGLVPAITAIRKQMTKPLHAAVLEQLIVDLEEGSPLHDAMRKHPRVFDPTYCAIVQAGEASATLTEMFERLAGLVAKRRTTRNQILGTLAYPVLLILMSVVIIGILFFFVLPRFAGMFVQLGVKIPSTTQAMMTLSTAMLDYWWAIGTLLVLGAGLAVWLIRDPVGQRKLINLQTSLPLVGKLGARLILAQVYRTMGLLIESKVGLLETLSLTRGVTRNDQFQKLFDDIEEAVTAGGEIGEAFEASGLVDPSICQAVKTGEQSGRMGEAFSYCADVLDESNTELVGAAMKLMEPVILICLGFLVGFVAISLFMPLFDLTAAMGG